MISKVRTGRPRSKDFSRGYRYVKNREWLRLYYKYKRDPPPFVPLAQQALVRNELAHAYARALQALGQLEEN